MESIKNVKWNSSINSIVFILLGLLLLIFPKESLSIGGYLIASILMLAGLGNIIGVIKNKGIETNGEGINLILSIAAITLSITIFTDPTWIIRMINMFIGVVLIISSIMNFLNLIQYKNNRTVAWWIYLVLVILVFIIGVVEIINPTFLTEIITQLVGASLITNTIITLFLNRRIKKYLLIEQKTDSE